MLDRRVMERSDEEIFREAHGRFREGGEDPRELPTFTHRLTDRELAEQRVSYREYLVVIDGFVKKFLSSVSGSPMLIMITDDQGAVLQFAGDPTIIGMVRQLGIEEGVKFNEGAGPNAIHFALQHQKPFQMMGCDHYHTVLHSMACYTAPFYKQGEGRIFGTLSLMTDIRQAHPQLLALLCTMADSVERELLLRRQNNQLEMMNQVLLDTPYCGVVAADANGSIVELNVTILDMLGIPADDHKVWLGRQVMELQELGGQLQLVLSSGEEAIGIEIALPHKGQIRYYMLDVLTVHDRQRTLLRVVGMLRDITEMKTTEEVLRNTEKLVFAGQLAVSIAHEIRNPLTTVKGLLQLAGQSSLSHYPLIMSELERMNLIVGEFLILGKPQAAHFKEESCAAIVQEVLNIVDMQASLNHIMITATCHSEQMVRCDRNQIKQVFLNILKNAMEALPFGGTIDLELDVEGSFQRIRFTDTGVGMTEDIRVRLGEPFHTTKPKGNGLGIMIVKRIIEGHGGNLTIASEPGEGTTVDVLLPLMDNNRKGTTPQAE